MSSKFIDAHEAARWVASGDTVCTVGMTLIGAAESILSAIEARFLTAGEPRDLTLLHAAGQSDRQRGIQHFAHPPTTAILISSASAALLITKAIHPASNALPFIFILRLPIIMVFAFVVMLFISALFCLYR